MTYLDVSKVGVNRDEILFKIFIYKPGCIVGSMVHNAHVHWWEI